MNRKVYIETSVISYLTARPSRVVGHMLFVPDVPMPPLEMSGKKALPDLLNSEPDGFCKPVRLVSVSLR
jgi:hypothetical protein